MATTVDTLTLSQINSLLARNPNDFGAHVQAGVLHSQNKDHDKAIFHLKKALSKDKKNPLILQKLGDELLVAKNWREALSVTRKLVGIKKRDKEACFLMYGIYDAMGEYDRAHEWIDKALAIDSNNPKYLERKANLLAMSGDMEASIKIHHKVLADNPEFPHSYWPIAMQQKHEGDQAVALLEKIKLAAGKTTQNEALRALAFAAGKIYQDIGDYEAAFAEFERGNLYHEIVMSADRTTAAHINFRETYTTSLIEEKAKWGNRDFKPIFILGLARSGTTLTESLCGAHSQVFAAGELGQFTQYNGKLSPHSTFENAHRDLVHGLDKKAIEAMSNDYVTHLSKLKKECPRITDKLPDNFLQIGLISILFPNSKIIHCRRHPMDNCLSLFSNPMIDYHKEYKSRLDTLGEYYIQYSHIMEFWKEVCPIPIHDVYYEDLVTNTQSVARTMMDYLELDWEDNVMERFGSSNSVKTLSMWQVRQPVFQTSKGKWLKYEKQLEPLRRIIAPQIADFEKDLAALDSAK